MIGSLNCSMVSQEFFAQGERLELDKTYRVAFVTEQGVSEKYGHNRHG